MEEQRLTVPELEHTCIDILPLHISRKGIVSPHPLFARKHFESIDTHSEATY